MKLLSHLLVLSHKTWHGQADPSSSTHMEAAIDENHRESDSNDGGKGSFEHGRDPNDYI